MVAPPLRVAIIGAGALAQGLADHFRRNGDAVTTTPLGETAMLPDALDLVIISDGLAPLPLPVAAVSRPELAAALHRMVYQPFEAAAALKPALAQAQGHLVLVTASAARMEAIDIDGHYLDRPFRAAAHALWRCLSVEWRNDGITCALVALERDEVPPIAGLLAAIAGQQTAPGPVELINGRGQPIGW